MQNRAHLTLVALGAAAIAATSCSSGLGTGNDRNGPQPASSRATGLGVDLGFDLTDPIGDDVSVAGALIPGVTEDEDRRIAFIAFTTEADADDADGTGTGVALSREIPTPGDANGAADVFLMAIEDELTDGGQPVAFSRSLVNVFRHDRCVHCHALGTPAGPGEELVFPNQPHPGGGEPVLDEDCADCHNGTNTPGLVGVEWRSPLIANGDFDFRGNTLEQLAARAQSVSLDEHLLNDGRVRWAIESGDVPFVPPAQGGNAGTSELWNGLGRDVGAVPISFATFTAQLRGWRDAGFPTTAEDSVRDVVLVSRRSTGLAAGNRVSDSPSITWVPNPAFDPANPSQPAGEVVIAYRSQASNLIASGNTTSDIYVSRVEVFVDRDPATSAPSPGDLDLVADGSTNELVSFRTSGNGGGNGFSDAPSIDASGRLVAFESVATNLVVGFQDGNGSDRDVFLRDLDASETQLVSATTPGGTRSGDGASGEAVISPTGEAVAFASEATDLVTDDLNGEVDVFVTQRVSGTFGAIERASVRTDGVEGSGGACSAPSVVVGPTGRVTVAFESDKTNLAPIDAPTNVFLREDGRTMLLSRRTIGGASIAGNGPSRRPRLSPTSDSVVFDTNASNLDAQRPNDGNGSTDAIQVDLRGLRATGGVEGRRITLDSLSRDVDGPSLSPRIATFRDENGSFATTSFATVRSTAEDLGFTRQDVVTIFLNDADQVVRTDFIADVVAGPPPLTVTFTDTSNGGPTAWRWDFGDGATSNAQNPTHTYASVGDYDVSLTVTRAEGSDTTVKTGFVRVLEPLSITGFSADNTTGPTPLQARFTAVLEGSQEGIEYLWDFGDGFTSTEESPLHTYSTVGTFDVRLDVTGLAGSDSALEEDYITTVPPSGASFSFQLQGLRAMFSDQSTGSPNSWTWDFGDGSPTSSLQNPTHDYADNGTYLVTLTVDGPGGMSMTSTNVTILARRFSTVFPSFAANGCTSCHSSSSPGGGLIIDGNAALMYDRLVNVLAQGSSCNDGVRRRVLPFDANASLLKQVVDPSVTACNDSANMGTWSAGQLADLVEWIDEGALE